jgi:hypothetical protein
MTTAHPPRKTTKPPADKRIPARTRPDATTTTPGVVTGRPLTWLRIEALLMARVALSSANSVHASSLAAGRSALSAVGCTRSPMALWRWRERSHPEAF